jgi:sugar-specific transcriptional regulator TrmB
MDHKNYFDLRNAWVINFHTVAEVVGELEEELRNMKERGLPAPLLDKKNRQIDTLVEFYNLTEAMLKVYDENLKDYRAALTFSRNNENVFLDMAVKQLQYMTKHFKNGAKIGEGIHEQPGILKRNTNGTK